MATCRQNLLHVVAILLSLSLSLYFAGKNLMFNGHFSQKTPWVGAVLGKYLGAILWKRALYLGASLQKDAWLIMCVVNVFCLICMSWLSHMCAMMHSYVCHDSVIRAPWRIHMFARTPLYEWHDSFVCVLWLVCKRLEQLSPLVCVCHDTFMCVCHDTFLCVSWLLLYGCHVSFHTCAMTHSYVYHDSSTECDVGKQLEELSTLNKTMLRCFPLQCTLQHAATHCNRLQQAATHCNRLQHTSLEQLNMTMLLYCVLQSTLLHTATSCNTL